MGFHRQLGVSLNESVQYSTFIHTANTDSGYLIPEFTSFEQRMKSSCLDVTIISREKQFYAVFYAVFNRNTDFNLI